MHPIHLCLEVQTYIHMYPNPNPEYYPSASGFAYRPNANQRPTKPQMRRPKFDTTSTISPVHNQLLVSAPQPMPSSAVLDQSSQIVTFMSISISIRSGQARLNSIQGNILFKRDFEHLILTLTTPTYIHTILHPTNFT
ncbi:hypothetical protein CPC08DRAFT_490649 [Agrocybe pediades]|nr:hypothetical protein CPC08DRAFT_490649 [Agrocybe pediades]